MKRGGGGKEKRELPRKRIKPWTYPQSRLISWTLPAVPRRGVDGRRASRPIKENHFPIDREQTLGTFRLDYEYEIEYEYDFRISNQ